MKIEIVIADHYLNITKGVESPKRVGIGSGSKGVIKEVIDRVVKIVGICGTKDVIEIRCNDSKEGLANSIAGAVTRHNSGAVEVKIITNKAAHVSRGGDKDKAKKEELYGEDFDSSESDDDALTGGTVEYVAAASVTATAGAQASFATAAAAPSSAPSTSGLESNTKWLEYHRVRDVERIENKEVKLDGRIVKITTSTNRDGTENKTIFIKDGERGDWREGSEVRNADGKISYIADGESVPAGATKLKDGGNYKDTIFV